jgi:hypothetical protein
MFAWSFQWGYRLRPAVFAGYIMTSSDHSPHIRQSSMSSPNLYHKINHKDDGTCPSPPSYHSYLASGSEPQAESGPVVAYGSLFAMYSGMAKEEDEKTVKDWKELASDTLTFVSPNINIVDHHMLTRLLQSALFSAVVAALLAISLLELQSDPQDKPTLYLENIYQLLADPNRTHVPTLPTPPAFSPPKSAVWVNSLWSLSLVMTLSSSLLAILVQQWARRYIKVTLPQSFGGPHQQARTRAFFKKGVEDMHLQWAIDAMPILLHASLVLFLVGLVIFSFGSNPTVFKVVASWVGLCTIVYACFTVLPIFRHDSTYHTPLSSPLWLLHTGALCVTFQTLRWLTAFNFCNGYIWNRFGCLKDGYHRRFSHGLERVAEECAQKSSPSVDRRILLWTLQSSRQDHELEQFFSLVPEFYSSRDLDNPLAVFKTSTCEKMADALVGLMARTLSSDLLPQLTKQRRIMICDKTMAKSPLLINQQTLGRVLYHDWSGLLDSVEFGLLLKKARYSDEFAKYYSQCVVSVIIARARQRDDRWFELATGQLDKPRPTLEYYLSHGDSILLANCIFISWRTFEAHKANGWHCDVYSESGSKTLELVSQISIQETLPELQHEFCDMWNELVRSIGNRQSRNLSIYILKHIRNLYCGLHQGTGAAPTSFTSSTSDRDSVLLYPQSYPSCSIRSHRPIKSHEDGPFASQDSTPPTWKFQDGVSGHATQCGQGYSIVHLRSFESLTPANLSASPDVIVATPHNSESRAAPTHFPLNHSSSSY